MKFRDLKQGVQKARDLKKSVEKVQDMAREAKAFTHQESTHTPEEVALKKAHLQESGKFLGIAAGTLILGTLTLAALVVVALDLFLPLWLALLIVTGGLLFTGQHLGRKGWGHLQAGKDIVGHLVTEFVKEEIRQRKDTHTE